MESTTQNSGSMGLFDRIIGIFTSPTETFQSIAQKPAWWMPFVIGVIVAIGLQLWLMDIGMQDQLANMSAKNVPQEHIDMAQQRMQGPMKYLGIIIAPVAVLVIWLVISGLLLLGANPISGGQAQFGQVMGVVAWSGLVTTLGGLLKSVLIYIQGTTYGVSTSLAALLPVAPRGETPSALYHILSKMDPFMVWQVALWGLGLAVVAKIESKKGLIVAFSLWIIWIVLSLLLRNLFANFM